MCVASSPGDYSRVPQSALEKINGTNDVAVDPTGQLYTEGALLLSFPEELI